MKPASPYAVVEQPAFSSSNPFEFKVFTFGGTSWFRARLCLGELNPPRHPSPPEPTEQTFGSHREIPSTTLQSFPTGMWSSVASASFAAPRRISTHGHQRRIPTRACTFFAPLRTRVRTSKDWCRRNPLLTIGTSMPAFASDRYPMPIHNPIDREASWRGDKQKTVRSSPEWNGITALRLQPNPMTGPELELTVLCWRSTSNADSVAQKKDPTQVAGSNLNQQRRTPAKVQLHCKRFHRGKQA